MRLAQSCEAYIDGASRGNPGPAGVGVVFFEAPPDGAGRGSGVRRFAKYVGETTNNVAEYLALIYALQEALRRGCTDVTVKTDSELLARQLSGAYRVRDGQLQILHGLARHLVGGFKRCAIQHVPRAQNAEADRLAARAVTTRATGGEWLFA